MIQLGEFNTLSVVRKSDLGYMLSDGKQEILMHFKQASQEIEIGANVDVFIYADKEKRMTATMIKPYCTINEAGFVEVIDVLEGAGVFVNINTPKDILISKDYLPYDKECWPILGDQIYIRLKTKGDILVGKPLNRFEIKEMNKTDVYSDYEIVDAYICKISEKGIGLITIHEKYVFVPTSQYRGKVRMGEKVSVCITKKLDNEYYGTLNAHKEELMNTDKEIIIQYLRAHGGVMPITAKSSSEEVEKLFQMSRKAFKRAYGALYKDRIIDFDENRTFLLKKE